MLFYGQILLQKRDGGADEMAKTVKISEIVKVSWAIKVIEIVKVVDAVRLKQLKI